MIDRWDDPELDKAQAENDAISAEIDKLCGLVESGSITKDDAKARFIALLERHWKVGERLLAVARGWGAKLGNA